MTKSHFNKKNETSKVTYSVFEEARQALDKHFLLYRQFYQHAAAVACSLGGELNPP